MESEKSEDMKLDDFEDPRLLDRNHTPIFEALKLSSSNKLQSSDKHFKQLSSITNDEDGLEDSEIEKRLRILYSQFFTNEFKQSQDKIRNKNQIFKQLFSICINDLQQMRDNLRHLKKEKTDSLKTMKDTKDSQETLR